MFDSESIWEYDLKAGTITDKTLSEAGSKDYLYALGVDSGVLDLHTIEDAMGKVETPGATVIRHLLDKKHVAHKSWRDFLEFVAVQYLRTPAMQERVKQLSNPEKEKKRRINTMRENLVRRLTESGAPKEWMDAAIEDACAQASKKLNAKDLILLGPLRQAEPVIRTLAKMKWSVLDIPQGDPDLFIGDHPVVLRSEGGDGSLGLSNKNIQLFMPLSPRVVVYAAWDIKPAYGALVEGYVNVVNNLAAQQCHQYVYATSKDEAALARAVEQHATKAPKFEKSFVVDGKGRILPGWIFRQAEGV